MAGGEASGRNGTLILVEGNTKGLLTLVKVKIKVKLYLEWTSVSRGLEGRNLSFKDSFLASCSVLVFFKSVRR